MDNMEMRRRTFCAAAAASLGQVQAMQSKPALRLGIDLFSLRNQGWTPFEYLDYCARQKVQVVHFSEIRFLGSLEEAHLRKVREHAARLAIQVEIGMRSICPTSSAFDPKAGTAEEQIARMLDAARVLGSPIVRAVLGHGGDRRGKLSIDEHIENTVKVLRASRSRILASGLKIAIENHAGDMQARELKTLIEEAGTDMVGACLDSGNPLWAIEDPHLTLETLAPYVLTSHLRDSAVWRTSEGSAVQWVRLGEGNVAIDDYIRRFAVLCPGKSASLEVIITGPVVQRFLEPNFWQAYRKTPAWEFSRFLALAEKGKPRPAPVPAPSKEEAAAREREDLEASLRWCRELKNV
jgi:sugar phosphate isomerase/epimerase